MIERVARDPSVDVDRLERLLAMRERMEERQASQAFDAAMAACQAEMRPVAADSNNPQTRSKYASYAALDSALRPIYTKHGLVPSFGTAEAKKPEDVRVTCRLSHSSGFSREYWIDMPADGKGAKGGDVMTRTHATGSAVSYGQRYLLKLIFNVAVGEVPDDDGNAAAGGQKISKAQLDELIKLADETGADKARFCNYFEIDGMADLPAARLNEAERMLKAKRKKAP
jgi:hypothetical protein